ncbi:hypothetical protein NB709_000784 [Xanthomonas sacchari]|nr:hypothetical protein [Xanthomonas sacchari]
MSLLSQYGEHFTSKQQADLAVAIGASSPGCGRKAAPVKSKKEVAPSIGCPIPRKPGRAADAPLAFKAWESTAAYKQWKASHPDEKFPKYPG